MDAKELVGMDIWIAEHVMGWRIYSSGRGSVHAISGFDTREERDYCIEAKHPWDTTDFSPTRRRADALLVLEKIVLARTIKIAEFGDEWFIMDALNHDPVKFIEVKHKALTTCICLYAREIFTQKDDK